MQIDAFGSILKGQHIESGSGVPCSLFKALVNYMQDDPSLDYLPATSEGEAVAIAAGLVTGGRPAFSLMQNSGLGNAVNPITSLLWVYRIPVMLFVSHRGQPGKPDEPQHELMGQITQQLAILCGLETHLFDPTCFDETLTGTCSRALPAAWIFPKGVLEGGVSAKPRAIRIQTVATPAREPTLFRAQLTREQVLQKMLPWLNREDALPAVISTTGKLSRELYELDDTDHRRHNRFYMVGSMGCAAGFGLGIACAEQRNATHKGGQLRKVLVLDGDGAVLMKMGTLGTIGMVGPKNFHHVVFDNGAYESTGGQPTCSTSVDLAQVALACGFRSAATVCDETDLLRTLERQLTSDGPTFLRVLIRTGSRSDLGRPTLKPPDGWQRFRNFLQH